MKTETFLLAAVLFAYYLVFKAAKQREDAERLQAGSRQPGSSYYPSLVVRG